MSQSFSNVNLITSFILAYLFLYTDSFADDHEHSVRPNIIYILADDLGYGDLGCYGQQYFSTPHIDRMAEEGIRFTQHYAGSTVCAPSRACLLTGLHTGHVFQRANGKYQFREDPQDICIASLLKQAGYHTAMIGKSGLSCNSEDGDLPRRKGFDFFFGFTSHLAAHRYYPEFLWKNDTQVMLEGNKGKEGKYYSGDLFLEETLSYLEERAAGGMPFFLHLPLQQPHADLNVPSKWKDNYIGKFSEKPFSGGHYRAESHPKSTYAGMVSYLDDTVGRILGKLKDLNLDENTIVFFSSDNGAMTEGGWDRRNFQSSGPLRGGKRDLYEGGIRVPLIVRWPCMIEPKRTTDHISAFWDFLATACDLAEVPIPNGTDGISLLPTLSGNGEQLQHKYLYWEFYERGGKQAVLWGRWKGIRLNVHKDLDGPIELYDLDSDLAEERNLANEFPEVIARIQQFMIAAHKPGELIRFKGEAPLP